MEKCQFKHQFGRDDIEIKSKENLYKGFFKIDLYEFDHASFAGGKITSVKREVFERGHAVAVLPYDPIRNEVVLIEQLRIGAIATKSSPWLLEIVAGMIDKEESKEQVAMREAQEEAGLKIKKLIPMMDYLSSPGGTTERIYLYLGIVDSTDVTGIYGLPEEQEDIRVQVFNYQQALDLLQSGDIDNAATVICMQWLALNKSKIDEGYKHNEQSEGGE